jgi:hypothetical protein
MQSEKFEFTFKLGLVNIYNPVPVKIIVNDQIINELNLGPTSNSINFIVEFVDGNNYTLSFKIEDINKPSRVIINNLNISWLDNNRTLSPAWRPPSPNEVWNYADVNATSKQQNIVRKAQNIDFDYFIPGGYPGFLRKFGRFEGQNGTTIQFNKLERPFNIVEPGSFKIDFTTPISCWLYRNLI